MAEIMTPGPTAAVTQQTLLSMWALAESLNDYRLLIHGYRVQTIKTESSWAVDLASVLEKRQDDFIYTGIDEGQSYQDYLGLLLSVMDKQVRILRAMDLIQINFRWMYYEGFLLREYNGGITFTYQIHGRTGKVEMQYENEAK